jgi:uncharacterized Zn finger protein (UPF0148 family)
MLCNNCHNEIPEGLIFCPHCGSKVINGSNGSEKEKALQKQLTEAEAQNQLLENRLKSASDQINSLSARLSEETSRKNKVPGAFKVFTVCFFGAAAALCIVLFLYMDIKTTEDYFAELYSDTYDKLSDAQSEIEDLTTLNEYLQLEVDFVDSNVAFINADDEEGLYHTFYCDDFIGDNFYVFNTNLAESEGFTPCPNCHY